MPELEEDVNGLEEPRRNIDRIDKTIVALLAERMRQGIAAGDLKRRHRQPVRSPDREAEVLAHVRDAAAGPLSASSAERIFSLIIEETSAVQEESEVSRSSARSSGVSKPRETSHVAYQGAPGAFSEDAARVLLGADASLRPCQSLEDVFAALMSGAVHAAVVPVENVLAGPVPGAAELIAKHGVRIVAEHAARVSHAVIGAPGATLEGIRRVSSHPMALAQCGRWLREHPHITAVPAFDTAGAVAAIVNSGEVDHAALGNRRAAELYGGVVLQADVQDHPDNFTRFVLVERA
jgi:chorismate mutase / prephenate dehydratase